MRIKSVDTIRLIAIISVIAIHSSPFYVATTETQAFYNLPHLIINQIARFAVPFFFIISGYFYGVKIYSGQCPISICKAMLSKLLILYIGWCFFYFMPYNVGLIYEYGILGPIKGAYWNLTNRLLDPIEFIFQGSKVHLWFLVSLIICIVITSSLLKFKAKNFLVVTAIFLYFFGALTKSYSATEIGFELSFNTRNGPFFGLIFFVSGLLLSNKKTSVNWFNLGLKIFLLGLVLHFSEIYMLMKLYNTSMLQDYVFGTYFMGLGAALIALSNHKLISNNYFAKVGTMTLGIYASHLVFLDIFRTLDEELNHPIWEVCYIFLVLGLSIAFTVILSKSKYTAVLVK